MKSYFLQKYNNLRFNRLTVKDGLSSDHIYNTFEDSRGFIWFTTNDGLNRYDGRKIKVYKNDINNERIIGLGFIIPVIEDKHKIMWVGALGGGLCRYVRETDNFIRYVNNPDDPFSISDNMITDILEDENGILWVGTQKGVLNKFDTQTGKFYHYKFNTDDSNNVFKYIVMRLFIDSNKNLWVCTGNGLNLFDRESEKFYSYKYNINDTSSLSCDDVRAIYKDEKGILWIGTNGGGLNKFNLSKGTFEHYRHDNANPDSSCLDYICDMCPDNYGMVWLASMRTSGQCVFDPVSETFVVYKNNPSDDYSIDRDGVFRIFRDSSGTMWLSTRVAGVYYYNEKKWMFEQYVSDPLNPDSLSSNLIGEMCEDNRGNLWIATSKGIDVFSKENIKINSQYPDYLNSLRAEDQLKLCCDMEGKIWISHGEVEGLLDMYDYETNEFKHFNNNLNTRITFLYEDAEGLLWVGYLSYGIKVFNKERTQWKTYEWSDEEPREINFHTFHSITEDNKSNIWLGSFGLGIFILNKNTGIFKFMLNDPKDENTLSMSQIIFPILHDKKGIIWIGILGHGFDKYDPKQNRFTHFTEEQGLASNYINGILEDYHGCLWISTSKGLSKFDPETESFRNFDINDGIHITNFSSGSALKTSEGKLFFGGSDGLLCFYPDNIIENKRVPNIVITGLRIFNKEVHLDSSITEAKRIDLSYKENFFTIEYAALDYTNPPKNHYAYKLEGIDKNWNYVGNSNSASYTNISPGNYKFRVKGSNNDGVWNEEGTSVEIIITPPFHQTNFFKGLSALTVIGGIGMVFRKRIEKIKKDKQRQEEFTRKVIELQENERKRFASELHDGLGQDLIIIKNKAQISFDRTDEISKLKEEMKEISELASLTINEAREISQNLRPNILDTLGLTRTLLSMFERVRNSTAINFNIEIDNIDNAFAREVDINVYRILQECLTNTIKHSASTEVIISIKKSEKEITILISDNGKGFDVRKKLSDRENKGFGLKGIPERVKLFGGSFDISSDPGNGTRIKIKLSVKS